MLFLSLTLLSSALFVIFSLNPVHSVFFLILVFLTSSIILFLLELEFISLLFILVYVGAIAVLFLFVVMMLEIKQVKREYYSFLYFLLLTLFCLLLVNEYTFSFAFLSPDTAFLYTNWLNLSLTLENIVSLGQVLYTYYFIYFLMCGIILLIAMLGAIVLTLQFSTKRLKSQFVFKQILKEKKNSVYLIK